MRVFRDLEIVEHLGSGIPRILKTYGKEAFEIRQSFVRVILKYTDQLSDNPIPDASFTPSVSKTTQTTVSKTTQATTQTTTQKILEILRQNPSVSRKAIALILGDITENGVKYHLKKLIDQGRIHRVGPHNGGQWQVINRG
jgi:ATP-dependent DNA helicase RecG